MIFSNIKYKSYLPIYISAIIYFVAAFFFSYSIDISMIDDGLRHIAFAANLDVMKNWGEVFPKSLFSEYDPWHNWHLLIALFLKIFSYETVHIAINTVVLFVLMLLIDSHIRRKINYDFKTLIYLVVFSIVIFSFIRYLNLRPDLLSGLYVLFVLLLRNKFWPVFIITLIYGPFYYVYYIYSAFLGLTFLIQKKYKQFFGIFLASILVLIYYLVNDGTAFIEVVKYVLTDQQLRNGLNVSESMPLFKFLTNINSKLLLVVFVLIVSIILYYKYSFFKERTLELFILISSILWLNQGRFFYLFLPIIIIVVFSYIIDCDKKKFFNQVRKYLIFTKKYINYSSKVKLFYFIVIPYSIFMFAYGFSTYTYKNELIDGKLFQAEEFNNKTILLNRMNVDIYKALYFNPTLHFVPSCGIGWFDNSDKQMKDLYVKLQKKGLNEEELYTFIKYVNADFYIHYSGNEEQILDFKKLENYGIIAQKINKNRIIFSIDKNK